jgi:hypothetical protein
MELRSGQQLIVRSHERRAGEGGEKWKTERNLFGENFMINRIDNMEKLFSQEPRERASEGTIEKLFKLPAREC